MNSLIFSVATAQGPNRQRSTRQSLLAPTFTGALGMSTPASHLNPLNFDLDLSHSGETLSIAKLDMPGPGKFEHASRVQDR